MGERWEIFEREVKLSNFIRKAISKIKGKDIQNIKQIPYIQNCTDSIFWSLVKQENNISELIQMLTDETVLDEVYVPNFGGEYTVADVSLFILQEKIKGIPLEQYSLVFKEESNFTPFLKRPKHPIPMSAPSK